MLRIALNIAGLCIGGTALIMLVFVPLWSAHAAKMEGRNAVDPVYGQAPDMGDAEDLIRAVMGTTLKDPESARYRWPSEFKRGRYHDGHLSMPAWELVVGINSKNGFGGYTGSEDYAFFFLANDLVAGREPGKTVETVLERPIPIAAAATIASKTAATSR